MKSAKAFSNVVLYVLIAVDYAQTFQILSSFSRSKTSNLKATIEGFNSATGDETNAATLRSMTFSNLNEDHEPQLLCNFLMELGACSTSTTDADAGTDLERAIFHEFDPKTMSRTAITTDFWGRCHVTAHFPASTDLNWIMEIVQESFPELPKYTLREVEDKDWVLHVQHSWKPIILPPFCLRFPWHSDGLVENIIAASGLDPSEIVHLQLQGGIAFGTGEHPTTQMCLDWIGKVCNDKKPNMKLMDYGSGSGILGMAACKLDDTIEVIGVDIDVDAVHIANENCQSNQVGMKNYLCKLDEERDDESQSVLLKAYYSNKEGEVAKILPEEWDGSIYDIVVANILAGPLVVLAPRLAGLLQPGGKLGLSGIMTSQSGMILEAYSPYFDELRVEKELGNWVLVTGTKKT